MINFIEKYELAHNNIQKSLIDVAFACANSKPKKG